MKTPVNGDLLRAARLAAGLSANQVAAASNISLTVVTTLEKDSAADHSLTLGQLHAVAHAAGITLSDLLREPRPPEGRVLADPDDDAAYLGRVLIADLRLVPVADLADATGWPSRRVEVAVSELDTQMRPHGLRVHRLGDQVGLRALDAEAQASVDRLVALRQARLGMSATEASLLRKALTGNLDGQRTRVADRPRLSSLIKAGVLRNGSRGESYYELTDDAAFAFDIPNG